MRTALVLVALLAVGAILISGGSRADSVRHQYLAESNELRTVYRYGSARDVSVRSLGASRPIRAQPRWLARARPLGASAPPWARRMYGRSLLVLHGLTDRNGAVIAGAREGWAYVWPRDAGTAAIAFAAAGYRGEARLIARFLLGLDLKTAARFHPDGSPVDGRAAQGDAAGWVAAAARVARLPARPAATAWRDRGDYQEGDLGDFVGNAIASTEVTQPAGTDGDGTASRRHGAERQREVGLHPDAGQLWRLFATPQGMLSRRAHNPDSGLDSAAAWAVRPFPLPGLYPLARRTLLRLAAISGRSGIVPSQDWSGGDDPWTAPTAWSAWSLAALARRDQRRGSESVARRERASALRLMAGLRRDATPTGLLPERVDARTGVPTSTTPLGWSHAFAILALRQLWP
jgi:hypothetical protein